MLSGQAIITAYIAAVVVYIFAALIGRPYSVTLAATGQISYLIYLFHWVVCSIIYSQFPLTGELSSLAFMLLCIVATLIISWGFYNIVEKPMLCLGKQIASFRPRSDIERASGMMTSSQV